MRACLKFIIIVHFDVFCAILPCLSLLVSRQGQTGLLFFERSCLLRPQTAPCLAQNPTQNSQKEQNLDRL